MRPLFKHQPTEKHTLEAPTMAVHLADEDRPTIIRLSGVKKIYDIGTPRETEALRGLDLEVSLAEIVIIFGTSGSGKSTLLNILAGLDQATTGTVEIDGKDLTKLSNYELALYHQYKVGMVFQSYNLVPTFTVMQNITMPARLAGFKREEYMRRGEELLKQFDLEKLSHRLPMDCSGGQQQRIGIMRAFMNRPAFIIADEPTGNLDSVNAQHIMKLFKKLNDETNTTMVIVTHDASLFSIADRVVHVLDGQITKQTILTHKAKIDPSRSLIPIEFKYRIDEQQALIEQLKNGEGEATDPAAKLEAERNRIAAEEKELRTWWIQLRHEQEQLAQRTESLEHEKALVIKEGIHQGHTRQQLLRAEIELHAQQRNFQEDKVMHRTLMNHLMAEEQRVLDTTKQEYERRKKTLEAEVARKEAELAVTSVAAKETEQKTEQEQQQLSNLLDQKVNELEILRTHKKALAHEKKQLEAEHQNLTQKKQDLEEKLEAEQKIRAKTIQAEVSRITTEKIQLIQQHMAAEQQQIQEIKNRLEIERQNIITQRNQIELQKNKTKLQKRVMMHSQAVLKTRQEWLESEEKRLSLQEEELEHGNRQLNSARSRMLQEQKINKLAIEEQNRELRQVEERLVVEEQDLAAQKAQLEDQQKKIMQAQQEIEIKKKQLERETRLQLSTARDILDHEKEQLQAERIQHEAEGRTRREAMERKLKAARKIIDKEMIVIKEEHELLDHEKELNVVAEVSNKNELKNISKIDLYQALTASPETGGLGFDQTMAKKIMATIQKLV